MALSLFPVRASIGTAHLPDGTKAAVLMSTEFARALSDLLERVGGTDGLSNEELAALIKALDLQATLLAEQLTTLANITDTLKKLVDDQGIADAFVSDVHPVVPSDDMQLLGLPSALPAISQQDNDLAVMLAMQKDPITAPKITVTGVKAGNTALTSLLTALAKSGVITDSTT